jgi:HKD family nuclease
MPLFYRLEPIITGSLNFTSPTITDSFEYSNNWNGTFDLTTAVSGSSSFTISSLTDSFEISDNWP